ncbi:MAG: 16S rRNA (guanine(966)-N(2))-methyltransferase RsmD [Parvibaculaceae bacterium]|nr:16S rRNA (guanine(966)-N(2))-methyltransferase RsmD [Parvibaculaceae bacterium]
MRIVGGVHKGRALATPRDNRVRPTSDRTREAIFNVLAHAGLAGDGGDPFELEGARVLDMFAGTGALGLEALSRGAAFALFVEEHVESRGLIRDNIEAMGLTGTAKIYRRDATRMGERPASAGSPFNLLFADPPYGKGLAERALASARDGGWLAPGALCLVEEAASSDFTAPEGFVELDRRRYGETAVAFLRLA